MQTLTIQITDTSGLDAIHTLEEKHLIRIVDNSAFDSPALPSGPISIKAFQNWIQSAEASPAVSLKEAKAKWANKKQQLQKLIR